MQAREMMGGKRKNYIMKTCEVINSSEKANGENCFIFPVLNRKNIDDINTSHKA